VKKLSVLRFCLCGALLSGIWIARTQQPVHGDLKLNKIRENLYEITPVPEVSGAGGNVTVDVTGEGVILVDDKYDWDHDGILAKVKTITDKPVRYVINTHQHGDHTGGNAKMLPMGVQLMISKQARENMFQLKMPGLPQISFENNLQLSLGDDTAEAFHFGRAHTNGDSVVLFRAQRVLSTGDMCVRGDEFPPLIDYSAGGSIIEWTKTLDSVLKLDFDTIIPGHGPVGTKQDLVAYRDLLVRTRDRVHEMNAAKKTKDEIGSMLLTEFHWTPARLKSSLDVLVAEMR
jgi:glyoxylase-like metal-dependent hydrolase (beta-lactamase superfamily II)